MTEQEKVVAINQHIAHTTGTEHYYKNRLTGLTNTDGVQYVAEVAGAHWLIDLVWSHQHKRRVRAETFQVWTLKEDPKEGYRVECRTDSFPSGHHIVTQRLPYTDFPKQLMPFSLWLENGVLILPAEH